MYFKLYLSVNQLLNCIIKKCLRGLIDKSLSISRTSKHSEYYCAKKWQTFQCECQIASGDTRNLPGQKHIDQPLVQICIKLLYDLKNQSLTFTFWRLFNVNVGHD